jgi:hypothetical protein
MLLDECLAIYTGLMRGQPFSYDSELADLLSPADPAEWAAAGPPAVS